jgi:hypothetical protein
MTPRNSRLVKGLIIVLAIAVIVAAVAVPVAYRARRARWTAQLGEAARTRLAAGETDEAVQIVRDCINVKALQRLAAVIDARLVALDAKSKAKAAKRAKASK